jgi:hypothetical protein
LVLRRVPRFFRSQSSMAPSAPDGGFLASGSRKGDLNMIGFLPGWLAVAALVICTGKLVDVVREKQSVPRWLLPAAGVLAAGTLS